MEGSELALIIFLAAMIIGRVILHRAVQQLTDVEKARLLDVSGFSIGELVGLAGILGLLYVLLHHTELSRPTALAIYFGLIALLIVAAQVYRYRKLVNAQLPPAYRRQYLLSRAVTYVGFAIAVATLFP